jgi:two-component system, NarL family, nitrate/nitrite response regulator NarL
MTIRLVLADDHPLMLNALEQLFGKEEDCLVLACCTTGAETLQAVRLHRPDVLLLDLNLPEGDGLAVLRLMHDEQLHCRVVLLTGAIDVDKVQAAMDLGICGVVLKEAKPQVILQCIRTVHNGGTWLERSSSHHSLEELWQRVDRARQLARKLTMREVEVVRLLNAGLGNKQIANQLFISEGTVKRHLHDIYERLGVSGRLKLVCYLMGNELV